MGSGFNFHHDEIWDLEWNAFWWWLDKRDEFSKKEEAAIPKVRK